MKSLPHIVEQHAEDAAFLWLLRDAAVGEPHFTLKTLARLDNRVEAHLDGLRVAGPDGWDAAKAALKHEEPGEAFAAAVLAFDGRDASRVTALLTACTPAPAMLRGVVSALGWLPWPEASKAAEKLFASKVPAERRAGVAAAAIHRENTGQTVLLACRDEDAGVQARAMRMLGELGIAEHYPLCDRRLATAKDPGVRFWAAWTLGLRAANPTALVTLKDIAKSEPAWRRRALDVLLRRLAVAEAHNVLRRYQETPELARAGVRGAGVIGDPALVPWLLEKMKEPPLARLAGESFSMITGCDLAWENFDGDAPKGFKAQPSDDPKDDNVALDSDENLPWPKLKLVEEWWRARARDYRAGARHLAGKPMTAGWCRDVLRTGRQRLRAAAALELAILDPRSVLFEVRAPAARQQATLAAGAAGTARPPAHPG